ncbi:hypothetical protein [Pseudobacter ginsenosidimutans]|uniref:Uncharacterized protein n=1 Tax=Pseudobacter ginsenosidimutans TaxID=661488 RepID=A0A4Q7MNE5_9BACT|nr:hypothetical protein [Pseudobacter ginsenosidimutans]QEC40299.1 hypothetical protein FSB84_00810 [Pseudobacter ginsenosidimutans]RZS69098.1 hypothetical protein EV199_4923 [Pseudobacter ginsenosidimutans]
MWEKINKVSVQITVAMICIISLNAIGFLLFFKELPVHNKEIATYYIGQLQGAIVAGIFGWLYTTTKTKSS